MHKRTSIRNIVVALAAVGLASLALAPVMGCSKGQKADEAAATTATPKAPASTDNASAAKVLALKFHHDN